MTSPRPLPRLYSLRACVTMWVVVHLVLLFQWSRSGSVHPPQRELPQIGSFAKPDPIIWIDGDGVNRGAYPFYPTHTLGTYLREAGLRPDDARGQLGAELLPGSAVHVSLESDFEGLRVELGPLPGNVALLFGYPIGLDHATRSDLQFVPGVGPKMAHKILDARENGQLRTLDDLDEIKGVGRTRIEQWENMLVPNSQVKSQVLTIDLRKTPQPQSETKFLTSTSAPVPLRALQR